MFIWIFATFCAFFIKGLCGFANTMVFTSILSFSTANINISPVELLLGYPTNLILAWKERKNIRLSICLPMTAFVLLGSVFGMMLLKNTDVSLIKFLLGLVLLLLSLEMLLRNRLTFFVPSIKGGFFIFGILTGFICGLFGIGALLAAYMSRLTDDSASFKGNLCFVFIAENTFRIFFYLYLGILTFSSCYQALLLCPVMLFSLFLGIRFSYVLKDSHIKTLVLLLLFFSSIGLIGNYFFG